MSFRSISPALRILAFAIVIAATVLIPLKFIAAPTLVGANVRVTTHDLFPSDAYVAPSGPPDVFQQNEPSVAVDPTNPNLVAVGMNDVRTLPLTDDSWLGLAVSTNGGSAFAYEALVPGYPGDTSAAGLASSIRGNAAASDPWLAFDRTGNLFVSFIAFQRNPPKQPEFGEEETNAIVVAKYTVGGPITYQKTVVIERGTVGLGKQEDKEAMTVDASLSSPNLGNVYVCWARFTGNQSHLKVARSTDAGESFQISDLGPVNKMQGCNLTTAPNGDVYVAWRTFDNNPKVNNPQDSIVYVARSTDGGDSFGRGVPVADFIDYQQGSSRTLPSFRVFGDTFLAADANGLYLAWTQWNGASGADIMVSRSKTNGATWETPVRPHSPVDHQIMPFIATSGGTLSIAWYDSRSEPHFNATGPVTAQCPNGATTGAGCTGMDVYYAQASTGAAGPLSFSPELRVTSQSFNPNLYGSIKAFTPFIGDYIGLAATPTGVFVVWTDNRDENPTANAAEDQDATTDPPALVNARSRDSNIYLQKIAK